MGLQFIEVRGENDKLYYPSDLIPTSHHLPLPYHMGFDMCASELLEEKKRFLNKAMDENALLVFEHDPNVSMSRVAVNEKGHFSPKEAVTDL